jgi:hypothetical protein
MNGGIKYDPHGRRLFRSESKALQAQERAARITGCVSGVIRNGEHWSLLFDPQAQLA